MILNPTIRFMPEIGDFTECNLVSFNGNPEPTYALTCRIAGEPALAILDRAFVSNNSVPYVDAFSGECISFGSDFFISFDPGSVVFAASTNIGDLVIADGLIAVKCKYAHSRGGSHFLDINSGELVASPRKYVVVRQWSIQIDPDGTEQARLTIFQHPASAR